MSELSITGWPHETTHDCGARAALLVSTHDSATYECRGTPVEPDSAYGPDGCGAVFERTRSGQTADPVNWKPGDPCASCGSTDTGFDPTDGGFCRSCGRSDGDES